MARKKKNAEAGGASEGAAEAVASGVKAAGESTAESSLKARRVKRAKAKPVVAAKKKGVKSAKRGAKKSEAAPSSVNKTQAVKDYLAANPGAKTREVREALIAQGIEISANYVSLIKSQLKRKKRAKARATSAAEGGSKSTKSSSASGISIELLVKAKQAAEALGGVEIARSALAALVQLLD